MTQGAATKSVQSKLVDTVVEIEAGRLLANPAIDFPKLAALAGQGRLDIASLVSKTRPLAEVNEGISEMRDGKLVRVVLTAIAQRPLDNLCAVKR